MSVLYDSKCDSVTINTFKTLELNRTVRGKHKTHESKEREKDVIQRIKIRGQTQLKANSKRKKKKKPLLKS